ncbi:hypothetical protein [Microbacterium psychrotolerans]|uniref:hypothetical protein n=1 Tax=Microbacterium psychrotolerans TaxID=3068321 RepID=UPI00280BF654|nr:hypothetical protein [Microbacterium sp. QXD-8]
MRVGVLHTVPALVPVFHGLLTRRRDDLDIVHTADPSLLSRAVANGITDDVSADLRTHLGALREAGATAVLVTCSSIGEAATDAAAAVGVPLVRVDAAMAAEAVRRARAGRGRILVLATLAATLGPTSRLVQTAAGAAGEGLTTAAGAADVGSAAAGSPDVGSAVGGSVVEVTAQVVTDAADARAAGDLARHDRLIAEAIADAGDVDVIVLAQASMASGAGDDARVLTSPESGATRFVESLPQ